MPLVLPRTSSPHPTSVTIEMILECSLSVGHSLSHNPLLSSHIAGNSPYEQSGWSFWHSSASSFSESEGNVSEPCNIEKEAKAQQRGKLQVKSSKTLIFSLFSSHFLYSLSIVMISKECTWTWLKCVAGSDIHNSFLLVLSQSQGGYWTFQTYCRKKSLYLYFCAFLILTATQETGYIFLEYVNKTCPLFLS